LRNSFGALACLLQILLLPSLTFANQPPTCRRDSELLTRENVPSCQGVYLQADGTTGPVHTNKLGIFEQDYPPFAAPGTMRILFFGSSLGMPIRPGLGLAKAMSEALQRGLSAEMHGVHLELINASDNGEDRAGLVLRLPALLDAYHPDAVVLLEDFQAHALQETYEFLTARKSPAPDLRVLSLGYFNPTWPIPRSWSALSLLSGEREEKAAKWAKAIHISGVQLLIKLGFWPYEQTFDSSPYLDVHIRLLNEIQGLARSRGARLVLVNLVPNDWDPAEVFRKYQKAKNAWYKPEHLASAHLLPWYHLTSDDLRRLDAWNRAHAEYVDVAVSPVLRAHYGELFASNDLHLSPKGVFVMAEEAAKSLVPVLRTVPVKGASRRSARQEPKAGPASRRNSERPSR
jgi:lysophospholipase L1-like esterase